jgi:hypothetical protein
MVNISVKVNTVDVQIMAVKIMVRVEMRVVNL